MSLDDGLLNHDGAAKKEYLLGLKYKLALVLVYNDRFEMVDKTGQITTKMITRTLANDGMKMKEPQSSVPSVGVNGMRSGGKITDFAY